MPITLTLSSNSGASIFRRTLVSERSTWPPKSNALFERMFLLNLKMREEPNRWDCLHPGSWARSIVIKLLERLNERGRQEYWKKIPSADLTIIPAHAQEPWLDSFLRHLARSERKSMVVPDDWGNLTAKIRFRVLPNYIGLWQVFERPGPEFARIFGQANHRARCSKVRCLVPETRDA